MERNLITRAAEFINEQRKKKRWTKAVTAMAAVVVFCTTYALILPAITQETDVFCGHEAHSHGADCYGQVLTCDLPEAKAHVHSDGCYEVERTLVCTQEESAGHTHSDACRTESSDLTCTSEEEGHEHGEGCYTVTSSVTCGQEESSGHTHGDGCWEETRTLVCTESTEIPEGGHVHGPECYGGEELTCTKEEHEHELKCYSNLKADLESASVWERTLPDELTGVWADDLLAVAETQLGYQESTRNYHVDEEGNKLGYTRYGDWYGSPYGHWCAMFVSFCLNYADIPTQAFPWEANCQQWIDDLTDKDLYRPAGDYTPKAGDLIFFNWDNEPDSDHVGIVQEVTLDESGAVTQIKTIEGNTSNQVKVKTYLATDESIMGYGELPENPNPPAESEEEGAEETTQTEEVPVLSPEEQ
ncbi:MAG: CHAP domain-containing protein, partial [Ruminiclostridium sp.]|nr:CHAP domain-containing protein [Ruminiclostridium sp.]